MLFVLSAKDVDGNDLTMDQVKVDWDNLKEQHIKALACVANVGMVRRHSYG